MHVSTMQRTDPQKIKYTYTFTLFISIIKEIFAERARERESIYFKIGKMGLRLPICTTLVIPIGSFNCKLTHILF